MTEHDGPRPAAEDGSRHVPVLLERVVALLGPALGAPGAVLVDATLGLGGHTVAFLEQFPDLSVVGIDRDPEALAASARRLASYAGRTTLVHAVYDELPAVLASAGRSHVQGVLLDLGVSSLQLDETARGFSYMRDAPLDMRMDASTGVTAAEVVNTYPPDQLARVLSTYGEERFARRIANRVVRARALAPIETTAQLVELIRAAVPAASQRTGGHPAKRTFQALRIEVNGELHALQQALPAAVSVLAVGGRIAVLAYHSLEDRLVKQTLVAGAAHSAPLGLPIIRDVDRPQLRLLTRGAVRPDDVEIERNPRATSARLRAAERIREAA